MQEDDAAVVPAASIENMAQVRMAYNVGTKEDEDTWTGWKSDIDVVTIDDAQQLPKASLTKTVQLLDVDGNPVQTDPDGLVSAKPGRLAALHH